MRHESQTPVSADRLEGKSRPLFSLCLTISAARLAGLATSDVSVPGANMFDAGPRLTARPQRLFGVSWPAQTVRAFLTPARDLGAPRCQGPRGGRGLATFLGSSGAVPTIALLYALSELGIMEPVGPYSIAATYWCTKFVPCRFGMGLRGN